MTHSMHNIKRWSYSPGVASAALLVACSGNVVTLGEGGERRAPPPPYSWCLESPTLEMRPSLIAGTLLVDDQRQLDVLEGCETIAGNVLVRPRFQPDLRPLRALRAVEGSLAFERRYASAELEPPSAMEDALLDQGWLPSLEGLEGLERVGSLAIADSALRDLSPLSHLQELTRGELTLTNLAFSDISALANVRNIEHLQLSVSQLESLSSLQLAPAMKNLYIRAPELVDASALQSVESVDGALELADTALSDLQALAGLRAIQGGAYISSNRALRSLDGLQKLTAVSGGLHIVGNQSLDDLDALRGLRYATELQVSGNPALTRLPDLFVSGLRAIDIGANQALREIAGFPGLISNAPIRSNPLTRAVTSREMLLSARAERFQVQDNPALQHLAIPAGWQSVQQAVIRSNASLLDLDIGSLEAIDLLSIADNPQLSSVDLGELVSVDTLSVINNPRLSPTSFDAVKTFEREMSGNAAQ